MERSLPATRVAKCARASSDPPQQTTPDMPYPGSSPAELMASASPSRSSSPASSSPTTTSRRKRSGRARTNAERGRAFRERRNKYIGGMEVDIYRLRTEIAELESVRAMWTSTRLMAARSSDTGSLTRLVNEYFSLFRYGFQYPKPSIHGAVLKRPSVVSQDVVKARIGYQEHFLRQVMAHDAVVGDGIGPEASIKNWQGYTLAHGGQRIDLRHITAIGSDDHAVIEAHVTFHGRITASTFHVLYPRALQRLDLAATFLHRDVRFDAVFRHEFTEDGKIQSESTEIAFVDGLMATGAPLADVIELLSLSIISPAHTISENEFKVVGMCDPISPSAPESVDEDEEAQKLRVEYILA